MVTKGVKGKDKENRNRKIERFGKHKSIIIAVSPIPTKQPKHEERNPAHLKSKWSARNLYLYPLPTHIMCSKKECDRSVSSGRASTGERGNAFRAGDRGSPGLTKGREDEREGRGGGETY